MLSWRPEFICGYHCLLYLSIFQIQQNRGLPSCLHNSLCTILVLLLLHSFELFLADLSDSSGYGIMMCFFPYTFKFWNSLPSYGFPNEHNLPFL